MWGRAACTSLQARKENARRHFETQETFIFTSGSQFPHLCDKELGQGLHIVAYDPKA